MKIPLTDLWSRPISAWLTWLASDGRPRESIAVRRTQITRLARERSTSDPWSMSTQDLAAWLASHPEWAPAYRRAMRSAVRGFYGWARATGLSDHDPAALLPRTRPHTYKPRPIPDLVVNRALDVLPDRERLMVELGRDVGLRRAEIAAVHTRNVELERGGVYYLRVLGKGRRERRVPIAADLARRLGALEDGWAFPSPARPGRHLTPAHVGKLVRLALEGGWTTHTLRHGYATAAYQVDRDLVAVRDLLGHSSVSTTQMYVLAPDDAMLRAAAGAQLRRAA